MEIKDETGSDSQDFEGEKTSRPDPSVDVSAAIVMLARIAEWHACLAEIVGQSEATRLIMEIQRKIQNGCSPANHGE
jgi:hypothetical protein